MTFAAATGQATTGQAAGGLDASGPWAWFHLVDQARLQRAAEPGAFSLAFASGGNRAVFTLHPEGSALPFTGALVRAFACPWTS